MFNGGESAQHKGVVAVRRPARLAEALVAASRTRRLIWLVVAATIGLALVVLPAPAALAQPSNDDFANATVIGSLPFSTTEDTSQATFDPSDPSGCSNNGSVWFAFTPPSNMPIQADTFGSDYDTVLSAWTGTQGALNLIACNDDFIGLQSKIRFHATGGTTYYFMLARCCGSGGNGGGNLHFSVDQIPAPGNDDFADATPIASLPFSATVDLFRFPTPQPVVFRAQAGTTYYFQFGLWCCEPADPVVFSLEVTPNPVADFVFSPGDPSVFDTVQFQDSSSDPADAGIASQAWSLGDGATATGCCPTHQYAQDGDYTVQLTVTTPDGRAASTSQVVHVETHDVAIVRMAVPNTAHVGQTIAINVYVRNSRYPERVRVDLFKSVPGGFEQVGFLTQSVPVRRGDRTTRFAFTNTITEADRTMGNVVFKAVATILEHRDARPGDNDLTSPPVRIT